MAALDRPRKPSGRHATRLRQDGIAARLFRSFNFLTIRDAIGSRVFLENVSVQHFAGPIASTGELTMQESVSRGKSSRLSRREDGTHHSRGAPEKAEADALEYRVRLSR